MCWKERYICHFTMWVCSVEGLRQKSVKNIKLSFISIICLHYNDFNRIQLFKEWT